MISSCILRSALDIYVCIYIYICVRYVCMYIYIYMYIHVGMCIPRCMYIYIYIYIYYSDFDSRNFKSKVSSPTSKCRADP